MAKKTGGNSEASPESLEKVREILFGNQVRTFDRQIEQVADRLSSDLAASRQESQQRYDALERFVKEELSRLDKKLTSELKSLTRDTNKIEESLGKSLTRVQGGVEKKIESVKEKIDSNDRRVREHILDEVNSLHEAVGRQHEELSRAIHSAVSDLASDKASRTNLALLFNEMAVRLSEESAPAEKSSGSKRPKA